MKDFDINRKLAELILPYRYVVDDERELILLVNLIGDTDELYSYGEFDYRDWAQIGGLMKGLKISLRCSGSTWDAESFCGNHWSCESDPMKAVAMCAIKVLK